MDRFLGGKSHQKEEETSKPRKKHSHRKHSYDDQRAFPKHQLLFPTNTQTNDPVPFGKSWEKNVFGPPGRLKGVPRSKIHHIEKNSSVKKILGAICNNSASRVQKSRSAKRSRRDHSPLSGGSSSSSPSQQAEHQRYPRRKKRRKENEEIKERRFDEDKEYRGNKESQVREEDDDFSRHFKHRKEEGGRSRSRSRSRSRRGDDYSGNFEHKPRNVQVSKKLTFSSSESQAEDEGSPSLHKEYLSPGFVGHRGSHIAENEVEAESSQVFVIADSKDASKNPVVLKTSKPLRNEQDLLTDYTDLTALITDELAMEQQKRFNEKSYLETVTQNLLNVFLESNSKSFNYNSIKNVTDEPVRKSSANQGTGTSIFEGLDFVTPVTSSMGAVNRSEPSHLNDSTSRSSPERGLESSQVPSHRETAAFGIFSKDEHVTAPKGNFAVNTISQFKPNSPEKLVPEHVEESSPHMPLLFQRNPAFWSLATTNDFGAGKPNDEVGFIDGVLPRNIDKGGRIGRKATSKPANCGSYGKGSSRPSDRIYREYLFSSAPIFPHNDDILELFSPAAGNPESLLSRQHNTRETERNLRRRTCTATSVTPIDYGLSVSLPPLPEGRSVEYCRASFLDEMVTVGMREEDVFSANQGFYQGEHEDAIPLHVNPCGSTGTLYRESTDLVEPSEKESFLYSVGLLNKKNVGPKKEDWSLSPKFYRRRMF